MMPAPANIRPVAVANATAFKPGQSGNPAGRRPGTRRRVTIEAQLAATQIVDDPDYRAALKDPFSASHTVTSPRPSPDPLLSTP